MLEAKGLTRTYIPKKGVPVVALDNVDLKIEDKGLVFILGKSGSGKSTLLNLLGGLDKYDKGDIIIKGKSTKDFSQGDFDSYRNTYVGFIFQEYNILDDFSVGANIALAIELQGRKATNEQVNSILNTLDLQGYGNRRTNELSGGQKQRIAIARALVKNPDIILADEPTGALDSKTGLQIFDILKELSKEKLVLVVSHDREFAEWYGDRVIELADGRIISDISKTTITNGAVDANIHYIEKEGVVVKEGYKLTARDLEMINHYLEKEKSLNISSKSGEEFKKRNVFVDTEAIALKQYGSDFEMIKSRLPFKMAFKMGASGLSHKKFRLFFTILLSLVAFTLFGVADSLAAYNKIDASVNSIIDSNTDAVALSKQREMLIDDSYTRTFNLTVSEEDIRQLNDSLGKEANLNFKPIYTNGNTDNYNGSFRFENSFSSSAIIDYNLFYLHYLSGFAEFTKEELHELGFTVNGIMPTKDDEIAITSYLFDHFQEYGYSYTDYQNSDSNQDIKPENLNNPQDLIGKYITLRNSITSQEIKFKVTAIIDTNFQSERYENLKNPRDNFIDYYLSEEFRTIIYYGYHSLGFVNQGYINRLIQESQSNIFNLGHNINLYYNSPNQGAGFYAEAVDKISNFDSNLITFFNSEKTTLEKDEIILPYFQLEQFYYESFEQVLREYAKNNYQIAEDKGLYLDFERPDDLSNEDKIEFYFNYLYLGEGIENNIFGDKSGDDILNELISEEVIVHKELYINYYSSKDEPSISKVVGTYKPEDGVFTNLIIIDDEFYAELLTYKGEPYGYALAKMPKSRDQIQKIVEYSYQLNDGVSYPLKNSATPMLETANDLVENVAVIFLYIGIAFAVFSALMLSNFIASSVSRKKREIGILRALGARSSDVFRIFFNESIIIGLINFFLASIATFIVVQAINNSLRTGVGLTVTIFNFSIRQVALLLLISSFVALFASFLPVYRIAKKKPVDAISNK